MIPENENKDEEQNKVVENTIDNTTPLPPQKSFPEPKVLEAVVDPKEKPKEGPTPFSFSKPQSIHEDMTKPTKGDLAKETEKKKTLEDLDREIAKDEREGEVLTYDDYKDSATMFMDMYTSGLTFLARVISKDTSDSTYEFPKPKDDKLKEQLTKILRKRKTALPIEWLFAGTLIPATATIVLKATDRRKEYNAKKKKEEKDPDDVEINKKGTPKSLRRPGRPTK